MTHQENFQKEAFDEHRQLPAVQQLANDFARDDAAFGCIDQEDFS
jgi:hypothetical protein